MICRLPMPLWPTRLRAEQCAPVQLLARTVYRVGPVTVLPMSLPVSVVAFDSRNVTAVFPMRQPTCFFLGRILVLAALVSDLRRSS